MTTRVPLSALALALFAGSALAADLPSRKGPPPVFVPPPPMWTGFYAGLNAGGIIGSGSGSNTIGSVLTQSDDFVYAPAFAAAATSNLSTNDGGFIGGGQIGYNLQFANVWVAGLEADIQGTTANGRASGSRVVPVTDRLGRSNLPVGGAAQVSKQLDYLGTVRGRLGYLIAPTLLVYATGGLAYGQALARTSVSEMILNQPRPPRFVPPTFGFGSFSDTRVGWTVGGGGEWMFLPNWSAKIEYLYYDLGSVSYNTSPLVSVMDDCACGGFGVASAAHSSTTRFDGHIVRAGVNYHFNFGHAPTVAGY